MGGVRKAHSFNIRRYDLINTLGESAMGTVHRVHDRLTGQVVTLKRIQVAPKALEWGVNLEDAHPRGINDALAREFSLLANLRHPHITSVLHFGWDVSGVPYFTMDLPEDADTIRGAAQGQPMALRVNFLVQLLQALAYLHRRDILHRDLKPENVLVTRDQVKVHDFGIAVRRDPKAPGIDREATGGPVAYTAPEILRGARASIASDLFAVGVIAFELFAERHPFPQKRRNRVVRAILNTDPTFDDAEYDGRLSQVVARLMAKDPGARPVDAVEAIALVSTAVGYPLAEGTIESGKSFSCAASMVGRSEPFVQLVSSLDAAVEGRGGTALVAGPSGIGKSRLLEELALQATAKGAVVLRGQARSEAAAPYAVWRSVLCELVLEVDIDDGEASVLEPVIDDLSTLLRRDIPSVPILDVEASQVRFFRTVEALFRRRSRPMLVLLEDLHWASSESLKLLAWLADAGGEFPWLLVGSYRKDERRDLTEHVGKVPTMVLEPLSRAEVEALVCDLMGATGDVASLVDLLDADAEGNPFCVVEFVRLLAAQAGSPKAIATQPPATHSMSGGIQRLVTRRIESVPPDDLPLLQVAAVAGRALDLALLARLHPDADIDAWLARCVDCAMVAPDEHRWRFQHDQLREGLVRSLDRSFKRGLHRQIAQALQDRGGTDPRTVAMLAYHFGASGDVEQEAPYAEAAGKHALASGAYKDATRYLERALAVGWAADEPVRRAGIERRLGEALLCCGQFDDAKAQLADALRSLGFGVPTMTVSMVFGLLKETLQQVGHRLRPGWFIGRARGRRAALVEAVLAHTQLSRLAHHQNDDALLLFATLSALNMAEAADLTEDRARLCSVMGAVLGIVPLHAWAKRYVRRARGIAKTIDDPMPMAFVLAHQAYVEAGLGEWDDAEKHLERSMAIYEEVGDVRRWEENVSVLGYVCFYRGELERALEMFETLERSGRRRRDRQIESWGLINATRVGAMLGHVEDISSRLDRAGTLIVDGVTKIVWLGACVHQRLAGNDLGQAIIMATEAQSSMRTKPPRSFMACAAYARVAEALLRGWKGDMAARSVAVSALKDLKAQVRLFPFAEPYALQATALLHANEGRKAQAKDTLHAAAQAAAGRGMRLEHARALALMAELGPEAERDRHRQAAAEIYAELGVAESVV